MRFIIPYPPSVNRMWRTYRGRQWGDMRHKITDEMLAWFAVIHQAGDTKMQAARDTIPRFGVQLNPQSLITEARRRGLVGESAILTTYTPEMIADYEGLVSARVVPILAAEMIRDKYELTAKPISIRIWMHENANPDNLVPWWAYISAPLEAAS